MNGISFTVPGEPVPRNSQKVAVRNGQVHQYLPQKVTDFKSRVAVFARQAMKEQSPFECELEAYVQFVFTAPKPKNRKEREALDFGLQYYCGKRPDLDNLLKAVGDALQGICFLDDKQIVRATLVKWSAKVPQTIITIKPIGN